MKAQCLTRPVYVLEKPLSHIVFRLKCCPNFQLARCRSVCQELTCGITHQIFQSISILIRKLLVWVLETDAVLNFLPVLLLAAWVQVSGLLSKTFKEIIM